jgi:hypothetical protein
MSPARVLRYPTVLTQLNASGAPVSILLGSGFSIALHPRYGYPALLDYAFPSPASRIRRLFATAPTTDFERVMAGLQDAAAYARLYGPHGSRTASALTRDRVRVARGFCDALATTHHACVTDVADSNYAAARTFLETFSHIFTINYDLLLYWALNRLEGPGTPPRNDGFLRDDVHGLVWTRGEAQRVFWLHGGLHLYPQDSTFLTKLAHADLGGPLISDISERAARGTYPLIVLEGTSRQKVRAIAASPYLQHAHDSLRTLQGALVVLGAGISDQDQHIRDAICDSRVSELAVGIYSGASEAVRNEIVATWRGQASLRPLSTPLRVRFFDSISATAW